MRRALIMCALGAWLLPLPAAAQPLKTAVSLAGSNAATDTMELQVPAGRIALDLVFYGTSTLKTSPAPARIAVTNLRATGSPGDVVLTSARTANGAASGRNGEPFDVLLTLGESLRITIAGEGLRPATTYKSTVFMMALDDTRQWELTLATAAKAVLVSDPIPALQFERPVCAWFEWSGLCEPEVGAFTFSLRSKTPGTAFTNLSAQFIPPATSASKTPRANFTIDNFTFQPTTGPLAPAPRVPPKPDASPAPEDTSRGGDANDARPALLVRQVPADPPDASAAAGSVPLPGALVDGPRWFKATISRLEPGEYSGALRFMSTEAAEDAADSRLALAINVRDPAVFPVAVLVIGSIVGWFTTKYLVAARKARDMARAVQLLRDRADDLARGNVIRRGWEFSNEATSYGLIKVRVALHRLRKLTKTGLPMLVDEAELTRLRDEADARLTKLEALRELRLRVQPVADNRPTVQHKVGGLLRLATSVLERAAFDATQQARFAEHLAEITPWTVKDALLPRYLDALLERRDTDNVVSLTAIGEALRPHVSKLLDNWPASDALKAATMASLQEFDARCETLALLQRDQDAAWAQALADGYARGSSLNELFAIADAAVWTRLDNARANLKIVRAATREAAIHTYDPVEVHLNVSDAERRQILNHPLRVVWTIEAPDGGIRLVETDDITLVQYFSTRGTTRIKAQMQWGQQTIDVPSSIELTVNKNPGYRWYHLFVQGGATELAAVAAAIVFAVITAIQTQYDSTFGTTGQYLGLFIWAAGAATGGNFLKQLGTNATPGGQADNALPNRT